MIRLLAFWLSVALSASEPALIVSAPGLAHDGGLLRVSIHADLPISTPGRLVCDLVETGRPMTILATASAELADARRLDAGAILALSVPSICPQQLSVTATLFRPGLAPLRSTISVTTPAGALTAVASATATLRHSGETHPLPWLWAEQAADMAAGNPTAAAVTLLNSVTLRLGDWAAGRRPPAPGPGLSNLALRDPIDDSVQPYRLHLPSGDGPFPIVLLLTSPAPGTSKSAWAMPPPHALAAAAAAGVAVVICYPAGDRDWNGAAARRIPLTLVAAARQAPLDRTRGAVISATPVAKAPFAVHAPEQLTDPAWWRQLPGPALADTPQVSADLAAVMTAPFTVVVGTREHRTASAANRRLAVAFRNAYATHAHAVPPQVDDDVDPALLAGRNLILIGNPRSNRILANLAVALPCTWDHRAVHGPAGYAVVRAAGGTVACLATLTDQRLVLVLDGVAPAWGAGLPLAGQTSPLLLPASP